MNDPIRFPILIFLILIFCSCESASTLTTGERFIEVTGGKVWVRVVGEGAKTPLLLLHGGPGVPSYYLNPLAKLSEDRPIIFFDQLGCGRSERHTDTTLMTINAYVDQLEELRKALELKSFYLYGQSWGTMLGIDYYLKYPKSIKALILSSPALSATMWAQDADVLIATLPDSIQAAINTSVQTGIYDTPEYQQAIAVFYQNFMARKLPWDANMDSTFAGMNQDIYSHMWGPSEFNPTGNLKNYDQTQRLSEVKVPTLFISGEFDEARPETVQYYQSLVPDSKFVEIKNAAHITMHDNPSADISAIKEFLAEIEIE